MPNWPGTSDWRVPRGGEFVRYTRIEDVSRALKLRAGGHRIGIGLLIALLLVTAVFLGTRLRGQGSTPTPLANALTAGAAAVAPDRAVCRGGEATVSGRVSSVTVRLITSASTPVVCAQGNGLRFSASTTRMTPPSAGSIEAAVAQGVARGRRIDVIYGRAGSQVVGVDAVTGGGVVRSAAAIRHHWFLLAIPVDAAGVFLRVSTDRSQTEQPLPAAASAPISCAQGESCAATS